LRARLAPLARAATSWDSSHPPDNVLDGDERTFWATTGMFPQEIVVTLGAVSDVSQVRIVSVGLRRISIHSCATEQPGSYETVVPEKEIADQGAGRQSDTVKTNMRGVRHVKIIIHAGWGHFAAISSIALEGHKA
jgi:heat shock protein beta-11